MVAQKLVELLARVRFPLATPYKRSGAKRLCFCFIYKICKKYLFRYNGRTIMKFTKRLIFYLNAARLPLVLAVIFAVQNQMFNFWLHIVPQLYLVRASLVTFSLGILLYGPAVFFEKKLRYGYLFVISSAISVIFISEYLYYSYSHAFLQANAIKMFRESLAVGGTVVTLLTPKILLFILNLPIVLVAFLLARFKKLCPTILKKVEKIAAVTAIVMLLATSYGWLAYTEQRD